MSADKITHYFVQNGCQAGRPVSTQVNSLILLNIAQYCLCCRPLALHNFLQLLIIVSSSSEACQQLLSEVIWTHPFKNARLLELPLDFLLSWEGTLPFIITINTVTIFWYVYSICLFPKIQKIKLIKRFFLFCRIPSSTDPSPLSLFFFLFQSSQLLKLLSYLPNCNITYQMA